MPLEDDLCDILKKARGGLGLSLREIADTSGLSEAEITGLERGNRPPDRRTVRALAGALDLRPDPLIAMAIEHWRPSARRPLPWVETVYGSVGGYGVQGYLLHDGGEALIIDTGYNAPAMISVLNERRLRLVGICLTHGHSDHARGIDRLLAHREVPVYLGTDDRGLLDWQPRAELLTSPHDGLIINVGGRTVRCLTTPGHTAGGICYQAEDPEEPGCFVGDTLFAASIGRSNPFTLYETHLDSVRRLLTLPGEVRLLPGHGPATTVAEEREHNPFASAG